MSKKSINENTKLKTKINDVSETIVKNFNQNLIEIEKFDSI